MLIRDATRDDLPAVLAMLVADELVPRSEDLSIPLREEYLVAFEAIRSDPNHRLVVVEDAGEVVGTLQLTFLPNLTFLGGWRAQIESVHVLGTRRGEGIGRRMLEWAIAQARARDCALVQLTTNTVRVRARSFYESLGFEVTHHGMKLLIRD